MTASPPFSLPGSPTAGPTAVPTLSGNPNGTYSVTVSLTGTDSARGSFTEPVDRGAASPCPPPSQLTGAVSGQRVQVEFAAPAMSGPQTLSPGDLLLTVGSHTWGVASASNAPHGTSGSLQRNPDGSGSLRFQNLALQTNFAQQPQENGSITWTCA